MSFSKNLSKWGQNISREKLVESAFIEYLLCARGASHVVLVVKTRLLMQESPLS